MGLIGYWKFAKLLNVGCPWILLLPLHNVAYIGILGNVAKHENDLKGEMDLSVWYVLVVFALTASVLALLKWQDIIILYLCYFCLALVWLVGAEIHYSLFKLYSKHPLLVSVVWFLPGVVLWQALVAEKRLEESV